MTTFILTIWYFALAISCGWCANNWFRHSLWSEIAAKPWARRALVIFAVGILSIVVQSYVK